MAHRGSLVAVVAAAWLGTLASASAQVTWTGGGANATWSTAGNWAPSPPGSSDVVVISSTTPTNRKNMTNNSVSTVAGLRFNVSGVTLASGSNSGLPALQIAAGGTVSTTANSTTVINQILGVSSTLNLAMSSGSLLRIGNGFTGSGTVNMSASARLELNGFTNFDFNGLLSVNAGAAQLGGTGIGSTTDVRLNFGAAKLQPGPFLGLNSSIGSMGFRDLTVTSGQVDMQIDDVSNFDQIEVGRNMTYGGILYLDLFNLTYKPTGTFWNLFAISGSTSGNWTRIDFATGPDQFGSVFSYLPAENKWVRGRVHRVRGADSIARF